MRVKAAVSFAGAVSMAVGEVRDVPAGEALNDLLCAGYVEPAEPETKLKKAVKADDAGRSKN